MNASSREASGAPVASRSADGVSSAITLPSLRNASRSQCAASSIVWLDTTIVVPDSAGLGRVIEQSIERSNVDLATEFVELISLQRAFQANARVITTSDGLLNDLLNIVR